MFSSRLPDSLEPNEFTRILEEKRQSGAIIVDLTQSNPTKAGFFSQLADQIPFGSRQPGGYLPSAQGAKAAREAIKEYYQHNDYGVIDSDDLFLTASTSEAYSFLLKLLTDPGDEILIPAPSYPLFDFLATLENVRPTRYLLQRDNSGRWRVDFSSLVQEISRLTRAIVVVNPNNPTGSYLTADELAKITDLCRSQGLALIVDEVFLDYLNPTDAVKPRSVITSTGALTFTLSGFSKILALPQVKLSWIHVNGPELLKTGAKQRLEFIADTYLSVNAMIQQAAPRLFSSQQQVQEEILARIAVNERRLWTMQELAPAHREGGWYAILTLPAAITDEQCCLEVLMEHGLIVHPGFFYDFVEDNCIVVSLITPEEEFGRGLALLRDYLNSHDRR